ncbi:hypothetical protein [Nocardia sp. NBC_01009]|uniref:hypothetical protein n=1 Tax=Nocardia sp. NBC_01009 TaxID=2975996 RepID=UPI0038651C12|nr:hypothetical protein OHA42_02455 [Nocardia sp. NBC_01009]
METVSFQEHFGIGVGGGQLGYGVMRVEGGELLGTETEVGFLECCADQQADAARVCARDSDRVGEDVVTRGGEEQGTAGLTRGVDCGPLRSTTARVRRR